MQGVAHRVACGGGAQLGQPAVVEGCRAWHIGLQGVAHRVAGRGA